MLNKFQSSDIAKIRSEYSCHVLYKTLSNACFSSCEEVKSYPLRPEQVFVEVIHLLDELKQQQDDVQWGKLYRVIRQDYLMQGNVIANDDLERIVTIIIYALASVLLTSYTNFYHRLAQVLLEQVVETKALISPKAWNELADEIEEHDTLIAEWIKNYMESDTFESDAFDEYFAPVKISEKGTPQHILFTKTSKSNQKEEFRSLMAKIMTQVKKHGMAGKIKALLNKCVSDEIIILEGTEKDIYNDLSLYYDYRQSYSAFSGANPKLILKKLD